MATKEIERKIAVIFATDVVGYSKSVEKNEDQTIKNFRVCKKILEDLFKEHDGRIFNTAGDSVLAEFSSAVSAVICATEFQKLIKERNESETSDLKMEFRIGINMGDVVIEGDNLYGDGVNIAARLEALAQPNGVCLSRSVHEFINKKMDFLFNDLGEQTVKDNKFHAFDVVIDDSQKRTIKTKSKSKVPLIAAIIGILVLSIGGYVYYMHSINDTGQKDKKVVIADKPTILVLSFKNSSGDPSKDFISAGIKDSIITTLSNYTQLVVQSTNTTDYIEQNKLPDQKIAADYGVQYKLIGAYQVASEKIRINVELFEIANQSIVWSKKYDFQDTDIFTVQDKISRAVLTELGANLTMGKQAKTWSSYFTSLEQFQLFMDWHAAWQRKNVKDYYRVEELWAELKPQLADDNPLKYGLEAWTIVLKVSLGLSEEKAKDIKEAYELSKKCVELGEYLPDSHALKAYIESIFLKDYENAVVSANKVVEIGQNSLDAMAIAAGVFRGNGDLEKSLKTYEKIIDIAPHAPTWIKMHFIRTLMVLGKYEKVEKIALPLTKQDHIRASIKSDAYLSLAFVKLIRGDEKKAREYFELQNTDEDRSTVQSLKARWLFNQSGEFLEEFVTQLKTLGLKDE